MRDVVETKGAKPKSTWKRGPRRPREPTRSARTATWCVYAIIDPRSDSLFYVGQTRSFARRKAEHLEGTDQISGLVIRQIIEAGFLPHFTVLERHGTEEMALRAEIFWIELLLSRGIALVNSQAFDGFVARRSKRRSETAKLADMQRLRALANGRTAQRTSRRPPSRQSKSARTPPEGQPHISPTV